MLVMDRLNVPAPFFTTPVVSAMVPCTVILLEPLMFRVRAWLPEIDEPLLKVNEPATV